MHFSKSPIKIYLDQKDYSRIGKGLAGNQKCDTDLTVYHFLLNLVNSGKIRIYFSWCHFIEALKYEQEIDILEPYCKTIDSLTQGHCIKWVDELEKTELELILSRQFNFKTSIPDDYPYGKFIDAIPFTNALDEFLSNLQKEIRDNMKRRIVDGYLVNSSSKIKKVVSKKLDKTGFLKNAIRQIPKENLLSLSESLPGFDLSNEEWINLLFGNYPTKIKLIRRCFDEVSSFKNFVLKYSKLFPQVKKMGDLFKDTNILNTAIMFMQAMYDINSNLVNEKNIYNDLIHKYTEYFTNNINNLCNKHNLDEQISKKFLVDTKFKGMPSINSLLAFVIEYYKRHKANLVTGRKPKSSDIIDLHHIRNLPYVDIYSTDRFFGEFAKRKSIEFGTLVVTSLAELKDILEKNIC